MNGEARLTAEGFDLLFSGGHLRGFVAPLGFPPRVRGLPPGEIVPYVEGKRQRPVRAQPMGAFSFEEDDGGRRGISGGYTFSLSEADHQGSVASDWVTWHELEWVVYNALGTFPRIPAGREIWADMVLARIPILHTTSTLPISIEAGGPERPLSRATAQNVVTGSWFRFSAGDQAVTLISFGTAGPARTDIALQPHRTGEITTWYLLPFGRQRHLSAAYWSGIRERRLMAITPRLVGEGDLEPAARRITSLLSYGPTDERSSPVVAHPR
jgi:hypothetical protein